MLDPLTKQWPSVRGAEEDKKFWYKNLLITKTLGSLYEPIEYFYPLWDMVNFPFPLSFLPSLFISFHLFLPALSVYFCLFPSISVYFRLFPPLFASFRLFSPLFASFRLFSPLFASFRLFSPLSASFLPLFPPLFSPLPSLLNLFTS
jgi:hypothetical protein